MWQGDLKKANAVGKNSTEKLFDTGLPQNFNL